jgi:acyl-CoA synthetase (AMP-forming)/AMP-acid ligase II
MVDIDPDDDFAVMYTSGSADHPKGVVMTHRGAISAIQSWIFGVRVADLMGWAPAPTIDADGKPYQPCTIVTTPFFHVSASHAGFLLALWIGMKVVLLYKWDPRRAVELVEQEKVSRFGCVPTMSAELIEAAAAMGRTMGSLRTIDSGGAKRPSAQLKEIAERVPHALPGTGFGMTETNGIGIGMRGAMYLDNPDAAGRLQPPLLEMKIVDDDDVEVLVGEVGELVLKGVNNMRCYLNQPEETAKALRDGWLYTGDLAKVDEHGMVTIVDRKKDMIIRGGENISCSEVQAALHHHPDVAEAAVFSIPDERLGEAVGCCVYLRSGAESSEHDLQEFLRSHIALHKIPKKIWFRDTPLPRGATEKADRLAIRAEYVS